LRGSLAWRRSHSEETCLNLELAKALLEGDEMHLECLHIWIGYLGTHFKKQKMLRQQNQMFYQDFGKIEDLCLQNIVRRLMVCGEFRSQVSWQNSAKIRINRGISAFSGSANSFNQDFESKFMIFMLSCLICYFFFQ